MPAAFDDAPTQAVVCVPARNEAERIGRLLASLAAQTFARPGRPLRVAISINNTTDATADVVASFAAEPRLAIRASTVTLPRASAHAGSARRLAMDAGADWIEAEISSGGVLISTDADAFVPTDWVAANLAALANADLVGGRLIIARDGDASAAVTALHAQVDRYWAAVRALEDRLDPPEHDPAPRHGDHTGASLALRVSLYRAVGGVPRLASGEDNALVAAVVRAGGRVRHCPNVWVEVSARETGRADGGMAREMARRRETCAGRTPYLLPDADHWRALIARRAAWRAQWPANAERHTNAIAYVAACEATSDAPQAKLVPIEDAIRDLEALESATRALA